jgi:hypothetical protein
MPDENRLVYAFSVEHSDHVRRQVRTGVRPGWGIGLTVTALVDARQPSTHFEIWGEALPDVECIDEAM